MNHRKAYIEYKNKELIPMIAHIEKGMIEGEESSDMQNIFGDIDFSL